MTLRVSSLKERIDNGADFAELARCSRRTQVPHAAATSGGLGRRDRADFEQAMNALQPGRSATPCEARSGGIDSGAGRRAEDMSRSANGAGAARSACANRMSLGMGAQQRDRAYVSPDSKSADKPVVAIERLLADRGSRYGRSCSPDTHWLRDLNVGQGTSSAATMR
jgi:hypothetical protein